MAPSGKSSRGRGGGRGGGKNTKPSGDGRRLSSTSSNPTATSSPASVTRRSLPQQYEVSPAGEPTSSVTTKRRKVSENHRIPSQNDDATPLQSLPLQSQPQHSRPSSQVLKSQPPLAQPQFSLPQTRQPQVSDPQEFQPQTSEHHSAQRPTSQYQPSPSVVQELQFTPPPQSNRNPSHEEDLEEEEDEEYYEEEDQGEHQLEEAPFPPPDEGQLRRHHEAQLSLEELLRRPGRSDHLKTLSEDEDEGLWFTRNRFFITQKISKLLKEKFNGPWYSWSVTPIDVQDIYFIQFANRFTWDPLITHIVRENFNAVCRRRMKGLVSYVRRKRKRPAWISEKLYKFMEKYWDTADAKERSENAANSRNSPRDGLGPHVHVGGPKAHVEIEQQMMKELGRRITHGELFMRTHVKKDGSYVDRKAPKVGEAYTEKLKAKMAEMEVEVSGTSDGASQTVELTTEQMNNIFLESTVQDERGTPYGLGSVSELYKKGKQNYDSLGHSSSSSTIINLQEQLLEAEKKIAEQAELNRKRELEAIENEKKMAFLLDCVKRIAPDLPDWNATAPTEPGNDPPNPTA